jgi:3-phosphoshikimate 1-carboxyvinyltransferase
LNAVDGFEQQVSVLKKLIEQEDSQALMGLLGHAQAARQHFNHMLAKNL